jgi:hypothetical protein
LSWQLAAAFIVVGSVFFVAGLVWASWFQTREREWMGTDAEPTGSDRPRHLASITMTGTAEDTPEDVPEPEQAAVIRLRRYGSQ